MWIKKLFGSYSLIHGKSRDFVKFKYIFSKLIGEMFFNTANITVHVILTRGKDLYQK